MSIYRSESICVSFGCFSEHDSGHLLKYKNMHALKEGRKSVGTKRTSLSARSGLLEPVAQSSTFAGLSGGPAGEAAAVRFGGAEQVEKCSAT